MPRASKLPEVVRKDVDSFDMALLLRAAVGLSPRESVGGEGAVSVGREIPVVVPGVDLGGWIAWALVGLVVFAADDRERDEPGGQEHEGSPGSSARGREAWARRLHELVPDRRLATREALRLVAALAMMRTEGNISRAAMALRTSRRAAREVLKGAGLYPWNAEAADSPRR